MPSPSDRKYTKTHEWIKVEGTNGTVGLTDFAVHAIKDIVYLELPSKGAVAGAGKAFGIIESVKAVFDLNAPMSGSISEVNEALQNDFGPLTNDPYGKGWLLKLEGLIGETGHLLDSAAYDKYCADEQH